MSANTPHRSISVGNTPLPDASCKSPSDAQPTRIVEKPAVDVRKSPGTTAHGKNNSRRTRREELAISNLLSFPTISQAATATRINEKTLRRWLAQPLFARRFRSAKRALLDQATDTLLRNADQCAQVLVGVAINRKAMASARVRAAVKSLELVIKAVAISEIEERLSAIETTLQRRRVM